MQKCFINEICVLPGNDHYDVMSFIDKSTWYRSGHTAVIKSKEEIASTGTKEILTLLHVFVD